jgi:GNAT superfamily N-acetyltransferase
MTGVEIATLEGPAAASVAEDLARLRVTVFREWPYLYEGSLDYERRYLAKYSALARATIVVARAGDEIVGASTALPLADSEAELQAPFLAAGLDPADHYYYGESVLLAPWRRRGIGVAFFAARETRARALGFKIGTFCAVVRPDNHPARPADYVPLDAFWTKRGYVRAPNLTASFSWRDVGEPAATAKPMVFWTKTL